MDNRYTNPKFKVKFLKESSLENTPITPGSLIATMDTENVYFDIFSVDSDGKRINVSTNAAEVATQVQLAKQAAEEAREAVDEITGMNFANDSNVVHNTGNETIEGTKTFNSVPYVDNRVNNGTAILRAYTKHPAENSTAFAGGSIQTYTSDFDMADETDENLKKAFGPQLLAIDKNGQYWGYLQMQNNYVTNSGVSLTMLAGIRRYINGELISRSIWSGGVSSSSGILRTQNDGAWLSFPKCVTRPTTTSTAAGDCVDVIVENYYSGTSGRIKFGSGLQLQWGRRAGAVIEEAVIQLLKPMTTANYFAVAQMLDIRNGSQNNFSVYNKKTTNFTIGDNGGTELQNATAWFVIGY